MSSPFSTQRSYNLRSASHRPISSARNQDEEKTPSQPSLTFRYFIHGLSPFLSTHASAGLLAQSLLLSQHEFSLHRLDVPGFTLLSSQKLPTGIISLEPDLSPNESKIWIIDGGFARRKAIELVFFYKTRNGQELSLSELYPDVPGCPFRLRAWNRFGRYSLYF